MSLFYRIAHAIGFRPWEAEQICHAARVSALFDREENERRPPYGAMLDLGCGTGMQSVALAKRGWRVTGIDNVPRAIRHARRRATSAGVEVHFLCGDVTALAAAGVGGGFQLFLDFGCFHGLGDEERAAYAREITMAAGPAATLLMFAFAPGRRGPLPRGASEEQIVTCLRGWSVVAKESLPAPKFGPARQANPTIYRLRFDSTDALETRLGG